jgi:2-polyprenyl-3-methyl-5-hydroxy-6-metoxy-1,4-benzoquinol methylase
MNQKSYKKFETKKEFIQYFTSDCKNVIEKNALITDLCRNKYVLDLGCIDHSASSAIELGQYWLHKQIKDVAKKVIGVDILVNDALVLNNIGYEIISADVENFNLNMTFDVIVAGDLIEHLSNIGIFFENIKKHMSNNSILIISTPNPFNIEQTMAAIFQNRVFVNEQHTVWLSPHNLWEITSRFNLQIIDFHWINTRFHFPLQNIWFAKFANTISSVIMKRNNLCKRDYCVIIKKNTL